MLMITACLCCQRFVRAEPTSPPPSRQMCNGCWNRHDSPLMTASKFCLCFVQTDALPSSSPVQIARDLGLACPGTTSKTMPDWPLDTDQKISLCIDFSSRLDGPVLDACIFTMYTDIYMLSSVAASTRRKFGPYVDRLRSATVRWMSWPRSSEQLALLCQTMYCCPADERDAVSHTTGRFLVEAQGPAFAGFLNTLLQIVVLIPPENMETTALHRIKDRMTWPYCIEDLIPHGSGCRFSIAPPKHSMTCRLHLNMLIIASDTKHSSRHSSPGWSRTCHMCEQPPTCLDDSGTSSAAPRHGPRGSDSLWPWAS
jgi:hypothetical protein